MTFLKMTRSTPFGLGVLLVVALVAGCGQAAPPPGDTGHRVAEETQLREATQQVLHNMMHPSQLVL